MKGHEQKRDDAFEKRVAWVARELSEEVAIVLDMEFRWHDERACGVHALLPGAADEDRRAADAIYNAAAYVRELEDAATSRGLRELAELKVALDDASDGRYTVNPFGFVTLGNRYPAPCGLPESPRGPEDVLRCMLEETAGAWSSAIVRGSHPPPASIVAYFDRIGFPMTLG
jgi:hypothetical protein